MTGLENAGNGEFLRQNHIAQFIDGLFFLRALRVLEFLNSVEDLAEVTGRIDGQFLAHDDLQFPGELASEHDRFALEIEAAALNEFAQRHDLFFLGRVDAANQRREAPILKLDDHRPLHIRRGRDYARRLVDLVFERPPIAQYVLSRDENMRIEIDHFLAQLTVKPGHNLDHKNEHRDAEHHAEHRDQRDDGKKRALRLEIAQREKKTERQLQFGDTVAANRGFSKRNSFASAR